MNATDTKFRSRSGASRQKPITARRRASLVIAAAAAAAVAIPAAAAASTGSSPVAGHVYVNDNTAGTNTIGAFDRHADGSLTPEAGSPFIAGGAGTGAGLASQGAIQISADGRFVIAVDAGSNQISVDGGNLTELAGSPVSLPPGATPAGIIAN